MRTACLVLSAVQMSQHRPVSPAGPAAAAAAAAAAASDCGEPAGSSATSSCSSDCVSAHGYPQTLVHPDLLGMEVPYKPFDPGPSGASQPPPHTSNAERQLLIQNRLLKSTLIKTLERLQTQIENNSKTRRLLDRLLELRGTAEQTPPAEQKSRRSCEPDPDRAELYRKYEALVKQNYQLEQVLLQSSGQEALAGGGGRAQTELQEFRAMAALQMSGMQQDWQDERAEKERALALNAQLHQQVEQLQLQLDQLQQRAAAAPLSEPFESVDPSGFSTGSSWGPPPSVRPPPRPMLPPPDTCCRPARLPQTARRSGPEARTRGLGGSARSVDEVLSTSYEPVRAAPRPLPPPGRRLPVESDQRRPAPLLPRDSGYSDVLGAAEEGSEPAAGPCTDADAAADRLRRRGVVLIGDSDWTTLTDPDRGWTCLQPLSGTPPPAPAPAPATATAAAAKAKAKASRARDSALPDEYAATNTAAAITCPHCAALFGGHEHLVYLNHVEECPCRRPRRPPPTGAG